MFKCYETICCNIIEVVHKVWCYSKKSKPLKISSKREDSGKVPLLLIVKLNVGHC